MKPTVKHTLIIDDHPLIIEAFMTALEQVAEQHPNWHFSIDTAKSCDAAQYILQQKPPLDLVFLDIQVPPSSDGQLLSGEDIGLVLRRDFPQARIIIATTYTNNYRLQAIFKQINPEGFLIKNDISATMLIPAIVEVVTAPPYYSKTVLRSVRKYISHDYILDKWDRLLLYELSQGTKMKELPTIMPYSIGAIEKRKRHLKIVFEVEAGEDRDLLQAARTHGFI